MSPKRPWGTGSLWRPKGSTVWWCKYYRDRQPGEEGSPRIPVRESTHTSKKREAQDFLSARLELARKGIPFRPRMERILASELANDLLLDYKVNKRRSLQQTRARWDLHLVPFFGYMRAGNISTDLIHRYIEKRQAEEARNATINRELAVLKRMFNLGLRAIPPKVHFVPPIPRLREDNVRKGFLDEAQREKLSAECGKVGLWLRAMFEIACTYGWREDELLNLRVRHFDAFSNTLRLDPGTTKNDEGREVALGGVPLALLVACAQGKQPDGYLFTRKKGRPISDFRKSWKKVCKAIGVAGLLFHDLRRTAARALRDAGVAEGVIMKIGGWKTRSVFERYSIVTQADTADAIRKLEEHRQQLGQSLGKEDAEPEDAAENKESVN